MRFLNQKTSGMIAAAAAAAAAAFPTLAGAARPDPSLDRTFGPSGFVSASDYNFCGSSITGLLGEPDGGVTAIGPGYEASLRRYSRSGGLMESRRHLVFCDAVALVRQGDGRVALVGGTSGQGSSRPGPSFRVDALTPHYDEDTSFGSDGTALVPIGSRAGALSVATEPQNGLVVGGFAEVSGEWRLAVARLTSTGLPDTAFGVGGALVLAVPGTRERVRGGRYPVWPRTGLFDVEVQPDGRIVAAGTVVDGRSGVERAVVVRLSGDGRLDPSFGGGDGITTLSFQPPLRSSARALVLQSTRGGRGEARIVVAGGLGDAVKERAHFALARLRSDGRLDRTFGRSGRVVTRGNGRGEGIASLIATPGANLAAVGARPALAGSVFSVARYRADGRLDRRFGAGGVSCSAPPATGDWNASPQLLSTPGDRLVAGAVTAGGDHTVWALVRYRYPTRPRRTCPSDGMR